MAPRSVGLEAAKILAQNDIDGAGQRIGSVYCRGTHRQYFNPLDGRGGNTTQIEKANKIALHPSPVEQGERGPDR